MNTTVEIAILLVLFSLMMLVEHKNIARFLVSFWHTGILQRIVFVLWCIIIALYCIIFGFIFGVFSYFIDESVRIDADLRIEKITKILKPKIVVKKATPLNHARTVAHVKKPAKKRMNVYHGMRALSIGLRLARMFKF